MFGVSRRGYKISIPVPIEPLNIGGAQLSSAQLDSLSHGGCVCWELLALVSSLQYEYEELKDRLCDYHQEYITKKRENQWHNPPCVCTQHPREAYCFRCVYCHRCGADLTTTSTPNFHRCSCPVCLDICCGLFGANPEQYQSALFGSSRVERAIQENDRCPRGSPLEDRAPHSTASSLPAPIALTVRSTALPPLLLSIHSCC